MDAILSLLSADVVGGLACLTPRDAAQVVQTALRDHTSQGQFKHLIAPIADPHGLAGKSHSTARDRKRNADQEFRDGDLALALLNLNQALSLAPHVTRRDKILIHTLRSNRSAVLLKLVEANDSRGGMCRAQEEDVSNLESSDHGNRSLQASDAGGTRKLLLLFAERDARRAIELGKELESLHPKDPDQTHPSTWAKPFIRLGVALTALGDMDGARDAFQNALRVLPHGRGARNSVETRLERVKKEGQVIDTEPSATNRETERGAVDRIRETTRDTVKTVNKNSPSSASKKTPFVKASLACSGFGLFASGKMTKGDSVVSHEPPLAVVPDSRNGKAWKRNCHFCFKPLSIAPTPCRTCCVATYCDDLCRASDTPHREVECETGGCWWVVLPSATRLAMRCVAAAKKERECNPDSSTIFDLHRRWDDLDVSAKARLAVAAVVACCASGTKFTPGEVLEATCAVLGNAFAVKRVPSPGLYGETVCDKKRGAGGASVSVPDPCGFEKNQMQKLSERLLNLTQKAPLYSRIYAKESPVYHYAWRALTTESHPVALATFPKTSRANHACDPNAFVGILQPEKNNPNHPAVVASVRAIRDIREGEEIVVSYGPVVGAAPRATRRAVLLESHGFVCACAGCCSPELTRRETRVFQTNANHDARLGRWCAVVDHAREVFGDGVFSEVFGDEVSGVFGDTSSSEVFSNTAATDPNRLNKNHEVKKKTLAQVEEVIKEMRVSPQINVPAARVFCEALDTKTRVLVSIAAVCHAHRRQEAAASACEALHGLESVYPNDCLTLALERGRCAALELACGFLESATVKLTKARQTLRAFLGVLDDDEDGVLFDSTNDSFVWSLEHRALYIVDALLRSFPDKVGVGERGNGSGDEKSAETMLYELD